MTYVDFSEAELPLSSTVPARSVTSMTVRKNGERHKRSVQAGAAGIPASAAGVQSDVHSDVQSDVQPVIQPASIPVQPASIPVQLASQLLAQPAPCPAQPPFKPVPWPIQPVPNLVPSRASHTKSPGTKTVHP